MFGLSVLIRLPSLNRPLGGQQWLTAQTLVIHSIWYERGIAACGFNPIVTFGLAADKNIPSPMGRMASPSGDRCFISQPPLGYILPYLVLTSLGLRPDVLSLQIFNLAGHLACVLFAFFIIRQLALCRGVRYSEISALVGTAVYIFMPVTLAYHGNIYSFEILVEVFFLLAIYLFLLVLERPAGSVWLYAALAATAFCMSYTEWLGVLFTFSAVVYALFHFRNTRVRLAALAVTAGTAAALCVTLFQYSQIAGVEQFLRAAAGTYLERSGISSTFSHENQSLLSCKAWQRLGLHYMDSFGWFPLVLAVGAAVAAFGKSVKKTAVRSIPVERAAVFVTLLPVVLHHLILFDFTTIHRYSVLKDAVFFSLLSGMLCYLLPGMSSGGFAVSRKRQLFNGVLAAAFVSSLLIGIGQFWKLNKNSTSECFKETGESIARTARPDEVVFAVADDEFCAQIVFYAHRNIASYHDEQSARQLIGNNGARRGIIFELDEDYRCTGYRYIE